MGRHNVTREIDEYTCTCGLRWDVNEEDPHPVIRSIDDIKKQLGITNEKKIQSNS